MRKKITSLLTACVLTLSHLPVSAQISGDVEENIMTVNIELPEEYKNTKYSMFVFNPGMDEDDLENDKSNKRVVQYYHQGKYSGSETIEFKLNTRNVNSNIAPQYKVLITSGDYQETQIISAYSDGAKISLLERVNGMSETDVGLIDEIIDVYNLRSLTLADKVEDTSVAKTLSAILKKVTATDANMAQLLKEAVLLTAVAEEKTDIVKDGVILNNDILAIDKSFEEALEDISAKGIELINSIKGHTYSDITSLINEIKQQIILKAVYYHYELGSGHVGGIVDTLFIMQIWKDLFQTVAMNRFLKTFHPIMNMQSILISYVNEVI